MTIPQNVKDALKSLFQCGIVMRGTHDVIHAHLISHEAEIEKYKVALDEYNDRTEWVQKTAKPKELGMHRADVLRLRIESAESRLAAANALLRSEAALLRAWARESREGGWSTHQYEPMLRRANELDAHLQGAGDEA